MSNTTFKIRCGASKRELQGEPKMVISGRCSLQSGHSGNHQCFMRDAAGRNWGMRLWMTEKPLPHA